MNSSNLLHAYTVITCRVQVLVEKIYIYRSFATTVSQLKICDFSGETF